MIRHVNGGNYYLTQRATAMTGPVGGVWVRGQQSGSPGSGWSSWTKQGDEALISGNGYTKLPSGLILQWGYAGGAGWYYYPRCFPNAAFVVTGQNLSDGKRGLGVQAVSTCYFYGEVGEGGYSTNQGMPFYWMAIGY